MYECMYICVCVYMNVFVYIDSPILTKISIIDCRVNVMLLKIKCIFEKESRTKWNSGLV